MNTVENMKDFYGELERNWEDVYIRLYSLLKMTTNKK